jgi:hypothetical protein
VVSLEQFEVVIVNLQTGCIVINAKAVQPQSLHRSWLLQSFYPTIQNSAACDVPPDAWLKKKGDTTFDKCLSGQMSFWANVFWENVVWANVFMGKSLSGQMSSGQMSFWANVVWAIVSGQMSLGKRRMGKRHRTKKKPIFLH